MILKKILLRFQEFLFRWCMYVHSHAQLIRVFKIESIQFTTTISSKLLLSPFLELYWSRIWGFISNSFPSSANHSYVRKQIIIVCFHHCHISQPRKQSLYFFFNLKSKIQVN